MNTMENYDSEQNSKFETDETIFLEKQEEKPLDSFDIEKFFMSVPNATEYFENPQRKCEYNLTMFVLLKNHFKKLKISTISDEYTRSAFNAVKAFETLKGKTNELKTMRKKTKVSPDNFQALLEFDYIINKKEIQDFTVKQKKHEEAVLKKMRDNRQHLECECCYEEINHSSTFAISCGEGHVFCQSCAIKGTDEILAKGCYSVKCFQECKSEFNLNSLQKVLMPDKFKILLAKVQEGEIAAAKIEGLISCPFCQYAAIPPENDQIFKCMNLDCAKKSCRLCKKLDHSPKECEDIEKNKKARLILEEKMTAALVRKCLCGKEIIKEGGCNVVTCSCGQTLCYFCGQSTISHAHLNGRCNSIITTYTEANSVAYVGQKIKDELLKMDPNLKIDADSILPTVHDQSADIPAHALRELSTLPEL